MRKILVTGFDPFGGESINPAYEAVKLLPEQILDARVIPLEVPTVFDSGPKKVIEAVSELQPDFVHRSGGRTLADHAGIRRHQLCAGPHPG